MAHAMSMRRLAITVGVCGLSISACGGGDDGAENSDASSELSSDDRPSDTSGSDDADAGEVNQSTSTTSVSTTTSTSTTTTMVPLAVASAELIDANVEFSTAADPEFAALTDPVDVAVGDRVRTDRTGFAVVEYFDGSLTRLDVDTEFEVLELVDDVDQSMIRTRMGLGRTWHRVQELGETGEYSVETAVATAVVRGTAFAISCVSDVECTFLVVEGTVLVQLADGSEVELVAPSILTVDADGAGDVAGLPFEGAFDDAWLFENANRDVEADAGFLSAAELYEAYGPGFATLSGTYTGTLTDATYSDCTPDCQVWIDLYALEPIDSTPKQRTFVLDLDCSAGFPCTGTGEIERAAGIETVPLVYDGASLVFLEESATDTYCLLDFDGDENYEVESGTTESGSGYRLTPSVGTTVDDRWVVSSLPGTFDFRFDVTDYGRCGELPYAPTGLPFPLPGGYSQDSTIDMTRTP